MVDLKRIIGQIMQSVDDIGYNYIKSSHDGDEGVALFVLVSEPFSIFAR